MIYIYIYIYYSHIQEMTYKLQQIGNKKKKKKSKRKLVRVSKNKDSIDTLMNSLKTKPKFTKMVEYSVECLKNLAVDDVSVEEMLDEGVIEQLMKVMQLNPFNEKIQLAVNQCLQAFARNERLAAMVSERLGAKPLVRSLVKHVEPETLVSTSETITALMQSEVAVDTFAAGGVTAALGGVLKNNQETPVVIAAAAKTLQSVTAKVEYVPEVLTEGLTPTLVESLVAHKEDPHVASNIVGVIGNMSQCPEAILELKRCNAGDAVMHAIELHPYNQPLLQYATICVSNLMDLDDVSKVLEVQPGLTQLCMRATNQFAGYALVADNVKYLYENKGVEWISEVAALAMADTSESEIAAKLQQGSLLGMARLCIDDFKVHALIKSGAIESMKDALKSHSGNVAVVTAAVTALDAMMLPDGSPDYAKFVSSHATALLKATVY